MQRNRVWLVLLVLVILAAALALWLLPREGSPARVAFEPQDIPSYDPARADAPPEPETPSPPPVTDAAPKTPHTPAIPETLAVPTWEPLPPVPAPRFRKLTLEDFGVEGDAEIARLRASVGTMRFRVTIRGRVLDGTGTPVAGAQVRAQSCGICGPDTYVAQPDFRVARFRHPSDPVGSALTNEAGEYVLELQVTGSEVADLLRAVGAEDGEISQARGLFQTLVIIRAESHDRRGNGRTVGLHPDAALQNIDLTLYGDPLITFAVRYGAGKPVPGAYAECSLTKPTDPAAGKGSTWKAYADEDGLVHFPREDGWQYRLTVNNGYGFGLRVFGPMGAEHAAAPITMDAPGPLESRPAVLFRPLSEAISTPPNGVLFLSAGGTEASAVGKTRTEGWVAVHYPPKVGEELVLLLTGHGRVAMQMPDVPNGYCAEYDPLTFPAAREVQLRVLGTDGKPTSGARIAGRVLEQWKTGAPITIDNVPSDLITDNDGRVNVRVLPGRPYRMMATLKSGEIAIKRDWVFTGPGPHEWRWQAESEK